MKTDLNKVMRKYKYMNELRFILNMRNLNKINKNILQKILSLSESKNLWLAINEWNILPGSLEDGSIHDMGEGSSTNCLCGQAIRFVFAIKNKINYNTIPENFYNIDCREENGLGCVCIEKFFPHETQTLKDIMRKLKQSNNKKKEELLRKIYPKLFCHKIDCKKKLTDGFCLSCARKHIKTARYFKTKRKKSNITILDRITVQS